MHVVSLYETVLNSSSNIFRLGNIHQVPGAISSLFRACPPQALDDATRRTAQQEEQLQEVHGQLAAASVSESSQQTQCDELQRDVVEWKARSEAEEQARIRLQQQVATTRQVRRAGSLNVMDVELLWPPGFVHYSNYRF